MANTPDLRQWVRADTRVSSNLSEWLDVFRGLAAFAVLLSHAYPLVFGDGPPDVFNVLGSLIDWLAVLADRGHDAVIIFFVMSGYLVGGPFLVRFLKGSERVVDYAIARVARLYVVVLPAIVLTLVLDNIALRWLDGQSFVNLHREDFFPVHSNLYDELSFGATACNMFFLQRIYCYQIGSNLAFWSLSNEAFYYLIWPSLILGTRDRRALWPAAAAVLVTLSSDLLPFGSAFRYLVYFLIWAAGALSFALSRERVTRPRLVGFAVAAFTILILFERLDVSGLAHDVALALAFVATLLLLDILNLRGPPVRKLWAAGAAFSFSLYATHLPVIFVGLLVWRRFGPGGWRNVVFLMALGLAVAAAALFYAVTERHTAQLRSWIKQLPIVRREARPS